MIFKLFGKSLRQVAASACAGFGMLTLISCGGGGGSAGNTPGLTSSSVAKLTLECSTTTTTSSSSSSTASALTPCSGVTIAPGASLSVTLTALDGNNSPVPNVAVTFAVNNSAVITPSVIPAVTGTNGTVTATLTTVGVTASTIQLSGSTNNGPSVAAKINLSTSTETQPSMQLLFSSLSLPSAGNASTNVTVTAVLVDQNNNALSGVPVSFSSTSGVLVVTQAVSDASGHATATLGTNGNPANRTITVTATGGTATATGTVNVTGTTISAVTAPTSLTFGALTKFTFNLQDSSGNNLANVPVTFSSAAGNTVVGDSSNAGTTTIPITNANGNIVLDVTPTLNGSDTITVSADGAVGKATFTATNQGLSVTLTDITTTPATLLSVSPQPINEYTSSSCVQINASYAVSGVPTSGTAYVTTSRGNLFSNSTCTTAYAGPTQPIIAGVMTPLYLNSSTAGQATVTISETTGSVVGPVQSANVSFIARLVANQTPSIILNAQADVVSPNISSGSCTNFSILTATVRDGSSQNNLVQGVPVQFTLVADASGGFISSPVVVTQANGQAQTEYCAGTGTTAHNGVVVQATIQSNVAGASVSKQYPLTVSGQSLFVSLGTGNTITALDATSYQQTWAVYVTDSAGNPVANANVSGLMTAAFYSKGNLALSEFLPGTTTIVATEYWQIVPGPNLVLTNPSLPFNATTNPYIVPSPPIASNTPTDGFTISGQVNSNTVIDIWCPNTDPSGNGVWSINDPIQIHYPNPLPPNAPFGATAGGIYPYVMPGIPGNVTSSGVTNTNGYATLNVTWPKDHSNWTVVVLTATANTGGTNSTASTYFQLLGAASDFIGTIPNPPGLISPYGINNCETAF